MSRDLAADLDVRSVASEGPDVYLGGAGTNGSRVFGGLLVGQALRAAAATVDEDRPAHSLHASFLRMADAAEPLRHRVERTRDGRSYSARRVVCEQSRGAVLVLTAQFQRPEVGPEYEIDAVSLPSPEALDRGRYDSAWFESRDVPPDHPGMLPHARAAWFRPRIALGDDLGLHQHALAVLSDHGPTRAAREPHLDTVDVERRFSVSLDHSVWFHRHAPLSGWVRSELAPLATAGGRGLTIGTIRDARGRVLISIAQESVLRFDADPT